MRVVEDASWLRAQLESLTTHNEAAFAQPWAVSDAPHEFTQKLSDHIVGIEMVIARLSGKWKLSQNQPQQNRDGVMAGLTQQGLPDALAMAELIGTTPKEPG